MSKTTESEIKAGERTQAVNYSLLVQREGAEAATLSVQATRRKYQPLIEACEMGSESDAEIVMQYLIHHDELLEACKNAAKLVTVARQYFPKSVRNSDRFSLELTCATVSAAISKSENR